MSGYAIGTNAKIIFDGTPIPLSKAFAEPPILERDLTEKMVWSTTNFHFTGHCSKNKIRKIYRKLAFMSRETKVFSKRRIGGQR